MVQLPSECLESYSTRNRTNRPIFRPPHGQRSCSVSRSSLRWGWGESSVHTAGVPPVDQMYKTCTNYVYNYIAENCTRQLALKLK